MSQHELTEAEARLRDLTLNAIPSDEARLRVIEEAVTDLPAAPRQGPYKRLLPAGEEWTGGLDEVAYANPVHLQWNLNLAESQI